MGERMPKKILQGVVVSNKAEKTITVKVERRYSHPKYGKTVSVLKKYAVHDPENRYNEGELVKIIEAKPESKTKKWHVIYA